MTVFHVIFIFITFLPHDFPCLFCSCCITLGFPQVPCCHKALRRTGVQGCLHSQATKVPLTFLPVPVVPGSVACRWSIWPLTSTYAPSRAFLCLCLIAGSHGAQLPPGTQQRQLLATLRLGAGPQMFVTSGLAFGIIHSCGHGRPVIIKAELLLQPMLTFK